PVVLVLSAEQSMSLVGLHCGQPSASGDDRDRKLLCHGGLVAYRLPATVVAHPDTGITIWSAKIFAELVTFDIRTSGDDGGVSIDANYHVGHVDSLIAKLSALARRD